MPIVGTFERKVIAVKDKVVLNGVKMPQGFPRKVLVSAGFGAGWSSWARGDEGDLPEGVDLGGLEVDQIMAEWPPLIAAVENGDDLRPALLCLYEVVGEQYEGGLGQLRVRTVDGPYLVREYDGSESIEERDKVIWCE